MSGAVPSNNPTGYLGLSERNPPNITYTSRNPLTTDTRNFKIGDLWYNKNTQAFWILVSLSGNSANWQLLANASSGSVDTISGNSGGAVGPDVGGNINVIGSGNVTVAGNPGANTLTASLTGTTNNAVQVGNAIGGISSIGLGTTNTVLLGQTGASPAFGQVPNAALQNSTIDVIGGSGITVVGSPVALGNSVTISAAAVVPLTFTADSGTATESSDNINILGTSAQGISTSASGSSVTLTAANATTTTKGVASFNGTNFSVSSGAVSSNAMTVTAGTGITGGGSLNLGGSVSLALTVPVTVPHGGTGLTTTPTNGQLLIGNTATSGYNLSTLTSTGGSVVITNGAGTINLETGATTLNSLTGDTGGAVPPTAGNINIVGTAGQINVSGNVGTSTLTLSLAGGSTAMDSFIPDSGTSPVVPTAAGAVTMSGSGSITTVGGLNTLTTQLTGLTNHAVLVGAGTTTITKVGPSATTGAPLISAGAAADPGFSTTFTIVDSSGITTLSKSASGSTNEIVTTNTSNTASSAAANIISVAGTSAGDAWSQWTVGSTRSYALGIDNSSTQDFKMTYANSASIDPSSGTDVFFFDPNAADDIQWSFRLHTIENATSYTAGAVGIGATNEESTDPSSSARIVAGTTGASSGDPYFLVTVSGVTTNKFGLDNSDSDAFKFNTGATSGAANLDGTTRFKIAQTGAITFNEAYTFPTADGTAGQVLTTNGAGQLSFSNSGVGTWTDNSGTFTAAVNTGYFLTAASTVTLPASPAQGNTVDIVCDTTGSCVITANTGQSIRISNQLSSVAGTATNSARGDSLQLVYRSTGATWFASASPNGAWTTA